MVETWVRREELPLNAIGTIIYMGNIEFAWDSRKAQAGELGMPYQNLINLFLRDCAAQKRRPAIYWRPDEP